MTSSHTVSGYRELLIGCGHRREKLLGLPGEPLEWRGLVTADLNLACHPDHVIDLNIIPWGTSNGLLEYHILEDSSFDEVHAYEVLEHLGSQGDAATFFAVFAEIWRVLKPGGHLFATVPSRYSAWLWGDPSHRRAILPETLVFLDQTQYTRQLDGAIKTPMSDFRSIYTADFDIVASTDNHVSHLFCLKALKPSRISV